MYGHDPFSIGSLPPSTGLPEIVSPDCCPSFSQYEHVPRGKDIIGIYEIKGEHGGRLGTLVIAARSTENGRLVATGVCTLSEEELRLNRLDEPFLPLTTRT